MLSLPIYLRKNSYYLHTRICGKQFKRSLNTSNKAEAIIRASDYMRVVGMADKLNDLGIDVRTYEIDLAKGIAKAENAEDHQRMMEALRNL